MRQQHRQALARTARRNYPSFPNLRLLAGSRYITPRIRGGRAAMAMASLILSGLVAALWASRYEGSPSSVWLRRAPVQGTHLYASVDRGAVTFGVLTPPDGEGPISQEWQGFACRSGPAWHVDTEGVLVCIGNYHGLAVPLWSIFVVSLITAARLSSTCWRAADGNKNLCLTCGYDLRASATRCPECGTQMPEPRVPTW